MIMTIIKYFALLLVLSISPIVSADENSTLKHDPATKLSKKLAAISSFKADFHQAVKDSSGDILQEFRGEITLKKPGKLYWQSFEPLVQTVVTNQQKQWYYDADLEQLSIQHLSDDISHTPAMILNGQADELSEHYTITLQKEQGDKTVFGLKPVDKNSLFELLLLHFDGPIVSQLIMTDSLQQTTVIQFSNSQLNPVVDDSLFEFVPPPGTEILVDE